MDFTFLSTIILCCFIIFGFIGVFIFDIVFKIRKNNYTENGIIVLLSWILPFFLITITVFILDNKIDKSNNIEIVKSEKITQSDIINIAINDGDTNFLVPDEYSYIEVKTEIIQDTNIPENYYTVEKRYFAGFYKIYCVIYINAE